MTRNLFNYILCCSMCFSFSIGFHWNFVRIKSCSGWNFLYKKHILIFDTGTDFYALVCHKMKCSSLQIFIIRNIPHFGKTTLQNTSLRIYATGKKKRTFFLARVSILVAFFRSLYRWYFTTVRCTVGCMRMNIIIVKFDGYAKKYFVHVFHTFAI